MASTAYHQWVNAGRPVTGLIRPLAQLRDKLRRYGYTVYDIGADDTSHLQAPTPEDHCPFSATGWPVPHPRWWLAAIDIMPPAGSGLPSLQQLGARIFADRQAGIFSSLKYINWEAQRDWSGDCWHDSWQPDHARRSSSDRGHIHLSGRSDRTTFTGDDGYDPVARIRQGVTGGAATPEEDPDMGRQMLIRADGKLWLVDGMFRRPVSDAQYGNGTGPISDGQVHQAGLLGNLGAPFSTGGDLDVWGIDLDAHIAARVAEAVAGIKPTLTDTQAAAFAAQVSAALVAAPDVPLGDADKPAIEAALRNVLRSGVGA